MGTKTEIWVSGVEHRPQKQAHTHGQLLLDQGGVEDRQSLQQVVLGERGHHMYISEARTQLHILHKNKLRMA